MIRNWILSCGVCLLAFAVAIVVTAPRYLSREEAEGTVGGVCLTGYRCQANVTTCRIFNFPNDPTCPHASPCRTCANGNDPLDSCVLSAGDSCTDAGNSHVCGHEIIGTCSGTSCNGTWYGTECGNGPDCAPGC
jgi:hypothetical protein